ncbi:type II secretion system pseudopilin PulG [Janthinobacterium sp. ROICE36]|uniref:type II secretion system protein n=1 Tax=Janthinobacterium sp. ROICE36 TaxID=2048670 RepID=UPI000C7F2617|nr:type II secretion system protein [Janthinobacterium sp. ROICE36]PLY46321.1 type II secretion system pseudopilin PulG [Janthinobacterium sp. ROICE36]
MARSARRQRGFTYLGLIILVAILGLVGAAGLKMGSLLQRQAAEQELLDIGAQFADALQSYAGATPAGQPQQPQNLAALLRDPRFPQVRRHLRKLYVDPITGRAEWGLLYQPGSTGIIGVHSLSQAAPLKVANFEARFTGFEGKVHFSEWRFMLDSRVSSVPSAGPAAVPASDEAGIAPALPAPPLFSHPIAPPQEQTPPEPVEQPEAQNSAENTAE